MADGSHRAATLNAGPVIDRRCYTSDAVFREEQELIFERSWQFLAHESEFKAVGDFRTTDVAGQPVVAIRGDDGKIRAFFNTCRHRGAIVETERRGCRKRFRCLYHHWEYDTRGELALVPRQEGFGPDFAPAQYGLTPLPRVESFHGLVFASLSADVPPLADYIGAAAPALMEIATYDGRPQDAVGSFEYSYNGNWKLLYENTFDDYHAEYLHARVYQSAPGFNYGSDYTRQKIAADAPASAKPAQPSRTNSKLGLHSLLEWHDPPEKMEYQKTRTHRVNIGIFPAFIGVFHPVLDMTGLRIIKPETVDRTTVLTYCLVPADLPKADKQAVAERFNVAWGPGGRIMMDDLLILNLVQKGLRAKTAGDVLATRGLHRGGRVGTVADEHGVRAFWDGWRRFMSESAAAAR